MAVFSPIVFLDRCREFETDELIKGFVTHNTWKIGLAFVEGFEFSLIQDSGFELDQLWDKMYNTLRKLRFFYSPGEPTSFQGLSEYYKEMDEVSVKANDLFDRWTRLLSSPQSAPIHNPDSAAKSFGLFHGRSSKEYLEIYLYGFALHSDLDKRQRRADDLAYLGEHLTNHNFYVLICILRSAREIIRDAADFVQYECGRSPN
ncbi:hypothetical protein [Leptonema illini]|uniref:Uncharacterized protein n=1 Tax=Leptonema illini DSM 21528 TaxID=929563 RepID=H2CER7_9LEPT|nr:hypothetical protein [Leptonema illini]EHQ06679.1 hypothetical protein Lepil_1998 [Leptonema illini DSM 21528]